MATAPDSRHVFALELIARDSAGPTGDAVSLDVPAAAGRLTVLARHAPLVASLEAGTMHVRRPDGGYEHYRIGGGTLVVGRDGVTVLADSLESTDS